MEGHPTTKNSLQYLWVDDGDDDDDVADGDFST